MKSKILIIFGSGLTLIAAGIILFLFQQRFASKTTGSKFDGDRALQDVIAQVNFGPRIPGSRAHAEVIKYIQKELNIAGWQSQVIKSVINDHEADNILATRNSKDPVLLLGAHYDSRILADNDPILSNRSMPVPGANDGASGVAILLEIARSLQNSSVSTALLFIDIEDNGRIPGWDWIQGSRAFSKDMNFQPKGIVIVDMIGDKDLNIFKEENSDPELTSQIWNTAKTLGYESFFIPEYKYRVLDDHIPFIEKGLRVADVIDLDYQYWHTTQDTTDKISPTSLDIVGNTLLAWIKDYGPCLSTDSCIQ